MSSNKHLKDKAIVLRKSGQSYNNIIKLLGIKSKGTLNYWFKKIKLSKKSQLLLSKNTELAYKRGLYEANRRRKEKINQENSIAYTEGKKAIKPISKEEILLIGVALYWAEGMKSEKTAPSLNFSNSDPKMIEVYLRFIREILRVPEDKIRAGIHIYPSIQKDNVIDFWSSVTKLPKDRFYIVNQVSISSKRLRPFNSLPHGTAVIKVNNRKMFFKMKGFIDGIIYKLT